MLKVIINNYSSKSNIFQGVKMDSKSIILNFWKKIITLIDEKLSKHKSDHSFKSVIWGKNSDGTYQISYLGQKYDVPNGMGIDLDVGQTVWVVIPDGIFRHMFIYAIHRKSK